MDVEQSNRAPAAFRASCLGAVVAIAATAVILFAVFVCLTEYEARLASGSCLGAFVICKIVRRIGRSGDPHYAKHPPDDP